MLIDFQNFTPPHHQRVATLPCEVAVLKNRNDPELTEANWIIFMFTDEKIFGGHTKKVAQLSQKDRATP